MKLPVYFTAELAFPNRRFAWLPELKTTPPSMKGKLVYSQGSTTFRWGWLRLCVVWRESRWVTSSEGYGTIDPKAPACPDCGSTDPIQHWYHQPKPGEES